MSATYLDFNATAPCCPEAVEAMLPFLGARYGNALSGHTFGRDAAAAIEQARQNVADLVGADPAGILFSGGGTEALNHAVKGLAFAQLDRPGTLLISATEHHAVEDSALWLARLGFQTLRLGVDREGRVDPAEVEARLAAGDVRLVAVMHANNEVGTVQPVEAIGGLCRDAGVPFLCDVVQSAGKIPVDVEAMSASMAAMSAHKVYGPKGVGALYVRPGLALESLLHGAGHEGGRRAGTHNVPGIVGFGAAAARARAHLAEESARLAALRDRLEAALLRRLPGAKINGGGAPRLPNTSNLSFPGILAQDLLPALDAQGVAVSAGAACRAGVPTPSPTLLAMGLGEERALGGIRLSLGRLTDEAAVDAAIEAVTRAVQGLRRG